MPVSGPERGGVVKVGLEIGFHNLGDESNCFGDHWVPGCMVVTGFLDFHGQQIS